jgi:hypothetical protein
MFAQRVAKQICKSWPFIFDQRILICPQADISLLVTDELMKVRPLNYVTWMMDDHLVRWRGCGWAYPLWIEGCFERHLQNASHVFVISHEMQQFYRSRFGIDSVVLHAPAPEIFSDSLPERATHGPVHLAYFGSLGPWQNDALELIHTALSNGECRLDVYTRNPEFLPKGLKCAGVSLRSPVSASEVQLVAAKYDAVVLPLSFRDDMRQMSYFNIATKFSECLGGPVPTLLIGPANSAMLQAARQAQAALLVDREDPVRLSEILETLKDRAAAAEILASAHSYVRREMSVDEMQRRWHSAFKV